MFYDYIFYKGYQLAKKSKNWRDTPILFATMIIGWCFILNFATVLFIIEGFSRKNLRFGVLISKMNDFKYIVACLVVLIVCFYYSYKSRWKRIITKYEAKEKKRGKSSHPAIPLIVAYIVSFVLGMLAAMYRNGDGIFG